MKISFNWISDIIDKKLDFEECVEILTDIGLEVEKTYVYSNFPTDLSQLLIGNVKECVKHPNADRLKLTTIDIGEKDFLKIVCGAPNVNINQTVIVAPIGASITSNNGSSFTIKNVKIRGVESNGMLCAEDEIGVGNNHDGIIVLEKKIKPGTRVSKVYKPYTDKILEIGLTPNRCDAISHFGVARDLRAAVSYRSDKQIELISPSISNFYNTIISPNLNIEISDPNDCRRFCGLVIDNIVVKDSPEFIKNRLKAIGLNPINNIIDITNYVMHELGQPLHAYDRDKIKSNTIRIKKFNKSNKFITLDAQQRQLYKDDLMICDEDSPMCMAGIYGGLNYSVSENTKTIFLESAFFNPVTIRKSSKKHGLNTDSSYRFERGVDLDNTEFALKRAAALIVEFCDGEIISGLMDEYPKKIEEKNIVLNFNSVDSLIGFKIDRLKIKSILNLLDFKINNVTDTSAGITIPFYRHDVNRECDVIEEILRIHGYNNIEINKKLNISISSLVNSNNKFENLISDYLSSLGFNEIMNNSLVDNKTNADEKNKVTLINSISLDISSMRTSLLPGMLKSLAYNINRKNKNLKFYEFGSKYEKVNDKYYEKKVLGILISGNIIDESWYSKNIKFDLYILKNIVLNIFKKFSIKYIEKYYERKISFRYGNDKAIISSLNKSLLSSYEIEEDNVFYATIELDSLYSYSSNQFFKVKKPSKYPLVRRDFSFIIKNSTEFNDLKLSIKKISKLIKEVKLMDVYKGKPLNKNEKSYSFSIILENEKKTLEDLEINNISKKIINTISKKHKAVLRG
jgi:phenylalanyl-tRNA synthetase beta chain